MLFPNLSISYHRAIALVGDQVITMAREFTPETDGERIQMVVSIRNLHLFS